LKPTPYFFRVRVLLIVIAFALASPAGARGIYKCSDGSGVPVYQDRPCGPGTGSRDAGELSAAFSVIPFALPAKPPEPKAARRALAPSTTPRAAKRRAGADRPRSESEMGERRHLKEGMSDAEVFARLGPPDLQSGKGGRKMRWTYLPAPGDAQTVTMVRFEDGKVAGVERSILR
jgi:hypothetical protein